MIPASPLLPATPCGMSSSMPAQSLMTTPLNPQRSRSTSLINQSLECAGTPPTSLNDGITVATPAFTAASYGGKYVSHNVRSDSSTEL